MTALMLFVLGVVPAAGADTVVVCPVVFREALQPWLEHRGRQGHSFAMVSSTGSPEEIRRQIREVGRSGRLRFVVLVGDAEAGSDGAPALRQRCVPVHLAKAEVNVLWGSEPHIAADNWYANLGDDPAPDLGGDPGSRCECAGARPRCLVASLAVLALVGLRRRRVARKILTGR